MSNVVHKIQLFVHEVGCCACTAAAWKVSHPFTKNRPPPMVIHLGCCASAPTQESKHVRTPRFASSRERAQNSVPAPVVERLLKGPYHYGRMEYPERERE